MSMDKGVVEGVDINEGTPVAGLRPGRNYSPIVIIISE